MNEYAHLVNDYLRVNNTIGAHGFNVISFDNLVKVFHNLKSFDRPDMYAVVDEMVILLEHFEFDASISKKNSMKGKEEEALLDNRINETLPDGEFHFYKPCYSISFENWKANFERCFKSHYSKISKYKENVLAHTGEYDKKVLMGFFIEHQLSPCIDIDNRYAGVLPYVYTKQFAEIFNNSPDLDFVLYAYLSGGPKIIYIDRDSFQNVKMIVDLDDKNVSLSKMNANEVVMYGGFQI